MNQSINLKILQLSDANQLATLANNRKIADNLTNQFPFPYTKDHAVKFIEQNLKNVPATVLGIFYYDELCGAIGIHPQSDVYLKNAEMGYWIGEPYWGKGIVTAAVEKMIDYAFTHFDIDRIFARPFGSNIASQKVLEKAGFLLEAKLIGTFFKNNQPQDELIYATRRAQK